MTRRRMSPVAHLVAGALLVAGCGASQKSVPATPAPTPPASRPVAVAPMAPPPPDPWAGATLIQPPALAAAQAIDLGDVVRTTLPNGVEIVVLPRHTLPIVQYTVVVKAGGLDEPLERRGLADFTAEMLQKGTRGKTADQISTAVESVGADLGASSDDLSSEIRCKSLVKDQALCLQTLADVVLHPTFPASEMDEVRQRAITGVKQVKDDPERLAAEFFDNALYGDRDARGVPPSEETLAAIAPADLIAFHDHLYAPGNTIIAVGGDVDPKLAIKQVTAAFGGWAKKDVPARKVEDPATPEGLHVELIDKPDLTQAGVCIGTAGIAHKDPDYYATALVNYTLGGGAFSSRLMKVVRSKNGDTYGVRSHFDAEEYRGAFTITTKTRVEKTLETGSDIDAQVALMHDAGPTQAELDEAKGNLAGSYPVRMQTVGAVLAALVDAELDGLPADYVAQYPVRMSAVTLDEAKAAAKAHLDMTKEPGGKGLDVVFVASADKLGPLLDGKKIAYEKIGYEQPVSRAAREAAARGVTAAEAAAARKVLEAAIAASGGPKALGTLRDVTFSGTINLTAGPQKIAGTAVSYETTDGASRQELHIGPITVVAVVGPDGAYVDQGGQRKLLTGSDLAQGRSQARFSPLGVLLHGLEPGVVLRGLPPDKEGLDAMQVDPPGLDPITYYFDGKTHLLSKIEMKQQGELSTITFSDYKPELGIQMAHAEQIQQGGMTIAIAFNQVSVNSGLKPDLFAVPK